MNNTEFNQTPQKAQMPLVLWIVIGVTCLAVIAAAIFLITRLSRQDDSLAYEQKQDAEDQSEREAEEASTSESGLLDLVYVAGGYYDMGDRTESRIENSQPLHPVRMSPFNMGKYEVTQQVWEKVMSYNNSAFRGADLPVEQVSWFEAVDFCNRLSRKEGLQPCYRINGSSVSCDWRADGYRLPTEAEWEYAARGGRSSNNFLYAGSNDPGKVAWFKGNAGGATHAAGSKRPNELGIYDLNGNVCEWCWDWYQEDYYRQSPENDPAGPAAGRNRVTRGGSWNFPPSDFYIHDRSYYRDPGDRNSSVGFRVVRANVK